MKKTYRTLVLIALLIPLLTSCAALTSTSSTTDDTSYTTDTSTDVSEDNTVQTLSISDVINGLDYTLTTSEIEDYLAEIETTSPVLATALVIPNVVEVTVTIEYSYTTTYRTPWGTSSDTVTDTLTSLATAFFINEEGYLVTNAHVVSMDDYEDYPGFEILSETVTYQFADSEDIFGATIIDYDTDLDLAVLQSNTIFADQTYLRFFNITTTNQLYYGEDVIAVGNANGYGISVTSGIISAPLRYFEDGYDTIEAIQTDAAINEGNSGGPLTNLYGSVVGINSFKVITSTSESLGYAIPSNIVMNYLDTLDITYYSTNDRSFS